MNLFTRVWAGLKVCLVIGCVLHSGGVAAQARWARQAGGPGQDYARKLAIDGSDNTYVAGSFTGPAQFGKFTLGGTGTAGSPQAYLAKYDAQGEVLWAQAAPANVFSDVVVDAAGNAYVLGGFSGSTTFGGTLLTAQAASDVVLVKYDPQGNVLWARAGGTLPGSQLGWSSVAIDAAGNAYVTGSLSGSANLGGGAGVLTSAGTANLCVAKYSSQGNPVWARQGGGSKGSSYGAALGLDAAGNIYLAGSFGISAVFGSTTVLAPSPNTGSNILLVKCNSNGDFLWAKNEGGPSAVTVAGLVVDSQGNSFLTGMLGGSPDRKAIFGPYTFTVDTFDGYLVKHDAQGNVLWANQVGGPSTEYATGVALDKAGNSYITGIFGSQILTLGPATKLLSNGNKLVFAIKYDPQGKVLTAQREALCGGAINPAIAVGPKQDIYLAGYFTGTTSFASTLLRGSADDPFVARLGDLSTPSTPDNFSCSSLPTPPTPVPAPVPAPVAELDIPNILTPNGDGLNDKLQIKGLVDNQWSLTIYSRWGRQVYTAAAYRQDWDPAGLPAGLYYYLLQHPTGRAYKGWVEVAH
jgi:gliding motility-associated-like protein